MKVEIDKSFPMPGGAAANFLNVNTPEDYEALESENRADDRGGAAP